MLKKKILSHCLTIKKLSAQKRNIDQFIEIIYQQIKKGGKLLICGNGGSAADAQHIAAEMLVRLRPNVNRNPLPAISLATDTSTITACGNDYNFSDIFDRPFKGLVNKNDILFVISTSGMSKNILKVLNSAKKRKIVTIGFLGKNGGSAKKLCNLKIIVKSSNTAHIQEAHIFLAHYILERLEDRFIKKKLVI